MSVVRIVYAPLPDDRDEAASASLEFATRAADRIRQVAAATSAASSSSHVPSLTIDDLVPIQNWDFPWSSNTTSTTTENLTDEGGVDQEVKNPHFLCLLLISCGPDGTVHRAVRKLTKALKEQTQEAPGMSQDSSFAVALLGHAVCKTSAEQMNDQIFATGRRLFKLLPKCPSSSDATTKDDKTLLLETQVELDSPEKEFDTWVDSITTSVIASKSSTNNNSKKGNLF